MSRAIDTQKVQQAADALDEARTVLAKAQHDYGTIKRFNGQSGYDVSVNGVRVSVATMDSRTYMAKMIRGREMIHLGALKALQARIDDAQQTVADLERKLRETIGGEA